MNDTSMDDSAHHDHSSDKGNCRETLRDLYPFIDGELSDDVLAHMRGHLEDCTDCFEAFDFEAELKAAIRRKCSNDELPPGLVDRLEACLEAELATE